MARRSEDLWSTSTSPIKGVLKRSRSFGNNHSTSSSQSYFSMNAMLLTKLENDELVLSLSGLSWQSVSLIKQALDARQVSCMSTTDLLRVIRLLCNKILEEKTHHTSLIALVCLEIHFKLASSSSSSVFLESLYNCMREWFNERDKLRFTTGGARRWTAYIHFLVEIYGGLVRDFQNNFKMIVEAVQRNADNHDWRSPVASTTSIEVDKHRHQFANLLLDTFQVVVSNPSSTPAEIECLHTAMHRCGEYLQEDNSHRVENLLASLRNLLLDPSQLTNASAGNGCLEKNLLEIVELAASGWVFEESQEIYYFPYTKIH